MAVGFKGIEACNATLAAFFGDTRTLGPATYELVLYNGAPDPVTGGSPAPGFGPLTIDNDDANFNPPVDGIVTNAAEWDFGFASAPAGTIRYIGYQDPGTGKNVYVGQLKTPSTVTTGEGFRVLATKATIKES
jgi:hypothetical protein